MKRFSKLGAAALLGFAYVVAGCSSSSSTQTGGGGDDGGNDSGTASGSSSSGAASSSGGSGSGGSSSSSGSATDSGVDLSKLHATCPAAGCPMGLTAVSYLGIAGPSGPSFCSCEIPCGSEAGACPSGLSCSYVADGPGNVCE
jgi:hypothetical protein